MNFSKLEKKFPKKRAIITGANSGVGYEIFKLLLAQEWKLLAIDLSIQNIQPSSLPLIMVEEMDVTDRTKLKSTIEIFCERHEGVDIIFNNAGIGEGVRFKDYSLEKWDRIIDINLKAVIAGSYFVFPWMSQARKGLIVNMASAAGYANLPNMSPYNVTKAGVIALSESLAHEFSLYGIQVLNVTPTFFQSNILQHSQGTKDVLESAGKVVNNSKLDSLDAAIIILSRLHKKSEHLKFPFSSKAIWYSKKWAPSLYRKLVRKFLTK